VCCVVVVVVAGGVLVRAEKRGKGHGAGARPRCKVRS